MEDNNFALTSSIDLSSSSKVQITTEHQPKGGGLTRSLCLPRSDKRMSQCNAHEYRGVSSVRKVWQSISFSKQHQPAQLQRRLDYSSTEYQNDAATAVCRLIWKSNIAFCGYQFGRHDTLIPSLENLFPTESAFASFDALFDEPECVVYLVRVLAHLALDYPARLLLKQKIVQPQDVFYGNFTFFDMICINENISLLKAIHKAQTDLKLPKCAATARAINHVENHTVRRFIMRNFRLSCGIDEIRSQSACLTDKQRIFELANQNGNNIEEIELLLKRFKVDINNEYDQDGNGLIHICMKKGLTHLPLILFMSKFYPNLDINCANLEGMTPLMLLASSTSSESSTMYTDLLLTAFNTNPNIQRAGDGRTPMHFAAEADNIDVLLCLLRRGADFNLEDDSFRRPDDIALKMNNIEFAQMIEAARVQRIKYVEDSVLSNSIRCDDVRHSDLFNIDEEGLTPVMLAAKNNKASSLQIVVDIPGCPFDGQNPFTGMTALAYAAKYNSVDSIKLLFETGANCKIKDMSGWLPLHHAVSCNATAAVKEVLSNECALTGLADAKRITTSTEVVEILHVASTRRHDLLVAQPLITYANNGNVAAMSELIEEGDNIDFETNMGDWPMYVAVRGGHIGVCKQLAEYGTDLAKTRDDNGMSLLHMGVLCGDIDIVHLLVSSGSINVNCQTREGETPLHFACANGETDIVNLLLKANATPCTVDSSNRLRNYTEYHGIQCLIEKARHQRWRAIEECLTDRRNGSYKLRRIWQPPWDHYLRNRSGETPLMVCSRINNEKCLNYLLESAVYERSHELISANGTTRGSPAMLDSLEHSQHIKDEWIDRMDAFLEQSIGEAAVNGVISHIQARATYTGTTALHECIKVGDYVNIIRMLIQADSSVVNVRDNNGKSALHMACELNRTRIAEFLISIPSIDIYLRSNDGTLAEELCRKGSKLPTLLRRRVRADTRTEDTDDAMSRFSNDGSRQGSTITSINFSVLRDRFSVLRKEHNSQPDVVLCN